MKLAEIKKYLSEELIFLSHEIELNLEYVNQLPVLDKTNSFERLYYKESDIQRFWIPWTEELGVWVYANASRIDIIVKENSQKSEITSSLTIGLSSVITGACLNLDNQVAIHANAISLEEKAIAFVGYSGMGKSTLSTYCASCGAGFVTDDVLTVDSNFFVQPGNPRIKLYSHTSKSLGLETPEEEVSYKVFHNPIKLGAKLHNEPIALGVIYLLAESSDDKIYAEKLSHTQAIFELLQHSYYAHALIPNNPDLLNTYSSLVKQIPVKKLYYPRDFTVLPKVYEFLSEEIHQ
ncbi:hypothetical protein [Calothrix sp. PCC 6303]|uniref:hypothetical protein n=1 Tax=Calothrix sp. PCC 6303 TaxID=1170562 RepID=UPI0002A03032|nr:hypothetical protein [Calothrix sp. PCC 6303]AFY99918.1 hypothetical protein Cal6303_0853 [Calothrix sp. PCC 6303]